MKPVTNALSVAILPQQFFDENGNSLPVISVFGKCNRPASRKDDR